MKKKQVITVPLDQWIANYEAMAGQPVMLTILVKNGQPTFVSCVSERYHLMNDIPDVRPKTKIDYTG